MEHRGKQCAMKNKQPHPLIKIFQSVCMKATYNWVSKETIVLERIVEQKTAELERCYGLLNLATSRN